MEKFATRGQETELVSAMVRQFPYGKVSAERAQRLIEHQDELAAILLNALTAVASVLTATFASLLEACHQTGYCNPDFTESRWPLEKVEADEADWEVVEHYLTKTGALEDGVKQLEKLATKGEIRLLTGSRRAMEYIAAHPDAQLDHPIILPLRAQYSSDYWCLPVFSRYWNGRQRRLGLYYTDDAFGSDDGWLVLRPKSSDGAGKRQK